MSSQALFNSMQEPIIPLNHCVRVPDLSLHRSNSHRVSKSCQRITTEWKHMFHNTVKERRDEKRKERWYIRERRAKRVVKISLREQLLRGFYREVIHYIPKVPEFRSCTVRSLLRFFFKSLVERIRGDWRLKKMTDLGCLDSVSP